MRDPRPSLPWSLRRLQRRVDYAAWMSGPAWPARRRAWHEQRTARPASELLCQICGRPRSLSDGALQHRSYQRVGHEADSDLVPLCREPCHRLLNRILESNPAWLKAGRTYATDTITAVLRAQRTEGGTRP